MKTLRGFWFSLLAALALSAPAHAADSTLTDLPAATTCASGDLLYLVQSAVSKKITCDNLETAIADLGIETSAGVNLALAATAPAATTGASQAGKTVSVTASDAVASTDTAGAAAGGSQTYTTGAAARNASGNADGGDFNIVLGAGIGTGRQGQVVLSNTARLAWSGRASIGSTGTGNINFQESQTSTNSAQLTNVSVEFSSSSTGIKSSANTLVLDNSGLRLGSGRVIQFNATDAFNGTPDSGFARNAAGVIRATNGTTGIGAILNSRLVEANTAGSGAPNVLVASESGTVLTNEGATAENYHTLPDAASGYQFTFIVQDTDGIRITAAAGDTIRPIAGTAASGAGGFIRCATAGAFITLVSINATEWIAIGSAGVWTIDI